MVFNVVFSFQRDSLLDLSVVHEDADALDVLKEDLEGAGRTRRQCHVQLQFASVVQGETAR